MHGITEFCLVWDFGRTKKSWYRLSVDPRWHILSFVISFLFAIMYCIVHVIHYYTEEYYIKSMVLLHSYIQRIIILLSLC